MMAGLAAQGGEQEAIMIDGEVDRAIGSSDRPNDLKAHRTASSPGVKNGGRGRLIGRTRGGMNTGLPAVTDAVGRPIRVFRSAGQVSDDTGAGAMVGTLPASDWLIADRGDDAGWSRDALSDKGIRAGIPALKSREKPLRHDERRNRIEIMFGRSKDWRRIATRYDRCPKVFLSAVAASIIFRL